jgi:hypothetical protein
MKKSSARIAAENAFSREQSQHLSRTRLKSEAEAAADSREMNTARLRALRLARDAEKEKS